MVSSETYLEGFLCPHTGEPCSSRSYAECKRFWECVREANKQKDEQEIRTTGGEPERGGPDEQD
ncbi:MAG: hypothetical protein QF577_10105 [Phycisphaerae bacterium]|jgi:hypothetical protein|nr:hypothetical protein [Phycisphaerae bacterium]MDP7637885.1 hypothetical protein [Phycisphaerae bacterium]